MPEAPRQQAASRPTPVNPGRVLVLACGALAREILAVTRLNGWSHVSLECLPSKFHNTPEKIVPALEDRLAEVGDQYDNILLGYGECGT